MNKGLQIFFRLSPVRQGVDRFGNHRVWLVFKNHRASHHIPVFKVHPDDWDEQRSMVKSTNPNYVILNSNLLQVRAEYDKVHMKLLSELGEALPQDFLKYYRMAKNKEGQESFNRFFIYTITAERQNALNTYLNLKCTYEVLCRYKPYVKMDDLTPTWIREFNNHLMSLGIHQNTISKHHHHLRKIIRAAIRERLIPSDSDPYEHFRFSNLQTNTSYLTDSEILMLESFDPKDDKEKEIVKDLFLFSTYTGLRFSDIMSLNMKTDIVHQADGIYLIKTLIKTRRIGKQVKIPLEIVWNGKALAIIDRYPDNFPQVRNGILNRILRQIMSELNINKKIRFHSGRVNCASKIGRMSGDYFLVQSILGVSPRTAMHYCKQSQTDIDNKLKKLNW